MIDRLSEAKQTGGAGRDWYVNSARDTMVVIDPRGQDPALSCGRKINRAFAMASKEVSVQQFLTISFRRRLPAPLQSHARLPGQLHHVVRRGGLLPMV